MVDKVCIDLFNVLLLSLVKHWIINLRSTKVMSKFIISLIIYLQLLKKVEVASSTYDHSVPRDENYLLQTVSGRRNYEAKKKKKKDQ